MRSLLQLQYCQILLIRGKQKIRKVLWKIWQTLWIETKYADVQLIFCQLPHAGAGFARPIKVTYFVQSQDFVGQDFEGISWLKAVDLKHPHKGY